MIEEWKDIEGFKDLYQVSNLGRIKSLNYNKTKKEQILKPRKTKTGYLRVMLLDRKDYYIHKLVAEAFIPNPNNYTEINHKDENKQNNNINNLEWCNHSYNMNYGNIKNKISIANSKKVNQYDMQGNLIKTWNNIINIEKHLGFFSSNISACCKNKRKQAYGFIWKYESEVVKNEL